MEMEMRGSEDIEIGEDITPSLPPLCSSLYDSFLHSHCSSCFSPLPSSPHHAPPFLYCSPLCSSPSHSSSAELLLPSPDPDLRAALRFLLLLDRRPLLLHRLSGLLTNHHRFFTDSHPPDEEDEIATRIRDGARAMAAARSRRDGVELPQETDSATLEEAVLCLVVTNAVEVQDSSSGRALGIAVYDGRFSWINHSCSPNASYRFVLSGPSSSPSCEGETRLRVLPSERGKSDCGSVKLIQGCDEYGPRVIVRSIKRIPKGAEVTVTYTDLLVPKAVRLSELWLKYRFVCCCRRCSALPLTYVDHALQEICSYWLQPSNSSSRNILFRDEAAKIFDDWISNAIDEYMSDGDPESCCEKLESILTLGLDDVQLGSKESNPQIKFRLHPLHHLSMSAYTTLASVHKLCATDLSTHNSETDQLQAFHMSQASAAYSLLLGGATHHLFQSESSLIASVANFWTNAGESLLALARSSAWSLFGKPDLLGENLSSLPKYSCFKCSLMGRYEENLCCSQARNADFEDITKEFLNCIRNFTQQVWIFLIHNCCYLEEIKDPIDFSWLGTMKSSSRWDYHPQLDRADVDSMSGGEGSISGYKAQGYATRVRISIYELGFHCLLYGALLANIYIGRYSHLSRHIQDIINLENNETN